MKNNKFAIFYSWQSYIGGYANRVYIKDKIISAFRELNIDIELLEDSRGTTGAPDIPNTILTKIVQSYIFVCDITPAYILDINKNKKRVLPNPNVMFKLGFAVHLLGWERVICVCMKSMEILKLNLLTYLSIVSLHTVKKTVKRNLLNHYLLHGL